MGTNDNQSSSYWFDILKTGLESRCCHQYQVDPFVFYIKDSVTSKYVDDFVIVSTKQETITSLIESLNIDHENCVLTY